MSSFVTRKELDDEIFLLTVRIEDRLAGINERIKYLEALMLSQTYLNARFLKHQAWVAAQKFVIAPDGCHVRLYQIPVGQKDPDTGQEYPMEFLFSDGVKSCMNVNVFVCEPPKKEKP